MKSLYIFTRDLRTYDNKTLIEACKTSTHIAPIFIFTPQQVTSNSYKSDNAIQFMVSSLKELNAELKNSLFLFYGDTNTIVESLINKGTFKNVYITKDYTPFAVKRENKLKHYVKSTMYQLHVIHDYVLHKPGTILTGSGSAYKKYTPYYRSALKVDPDPVSNVVLPKLLKVDSNYSFKKAEQLYPLNPQLICKVADLTD